MVRTADSARSTAALIAPTASCACRDSRRTPREAVSATATPMPTASTVTTAARRRPAPSRPARRRRHHRPGALDDPGGDRRPQQRGPAPPRDIRSPVRRRSYSATGSRSSRSASLPAGGADDALGRRAAARTAGRRRAARRRRGRRRARRTPAARLLAPTAAITRETSAGWASDPAAATERQYGRQQRGRRCGRSSRSVADAGAARRRRSRRCSAGRPVSRRAQRADRRRSAAGRGAR